MDEKDYITRFEVDEMLKRVDDENRRQNHRIDKLETMAEQLADMAASIKVMAVSMQGMQAEQKEQGKRLKKIEEEPADNWRKFTWTAFACIVTGIIGFVLAKIGV